MELLVQAKTFIKRLWFTVWADDLVQSGHCVRNICDKYNFLCIKICFLTLMTPQHCGYLLYFLCVGPLSFKSLPRSCKSMLKLFCQRLLHGLIVWGGENQTNSYSLLHPHSSPLELTGIVKRTSVQEKWCWMTLRMFALIMLKRVSVCVRSRPFNPAGIPGPVIKSMLENHGARLAVMLEESSLCSSLLMVGEGGWEQPCTQSVGFTLVFRCVESEFLPE